MKAIEQLSLGKYGGRAEEAFKNFLRMPNPGKIGATTALNQQRGPVHIATETTNTNNHQASLKNNSEITFAIESHRNKKVTRIQSLNNDLNLKTEGMSHRMTGRI